MGWLAKDMAGKVSLGPNLEYLFYEKDAKKMSRQLVTELSEANASPRHWKHVPGEVCILVRRWNGDSRT